MARPKKQIEYTIPDSIYSLEPIKEINGRKIFKDNPFITPGNFCIQVRKDMSLIGSGLEIKDQNGEEVKAGVIGQIRLVDKEEFLKLYTKNVGIIFDISQTAQRALIAVFATIQSEAKDIAHIFLPYHKAKDLYIELNFNKIPSKSSFSQGIKQLIDYGFLAAHYNGESWYWFNPNLIFNGDRVKFVQEYRIKRKTTKQEQFSLLENKKKTNNKKTLVTLEDLALENKTLENKILKELT